MTLVGTALLTSIALDTVPRHEIMRLAKRQTERKIESSDDSWRTADTRITGTSWEA
jgi:hypothetical protein